MLLSSVAPRRDHSVGRHQMTSLRLSQSHTPLSRQPITAIAQFFDGSRASLQRMFPAKDRGPRFLELLLFANDGLNDARCNKADSRDGFPIALAMKNLGFGLGHPRVACGIRPEYAVE